MIETTVKERPILFSGPMVKAILEGRKGMTRRVIKPQPHECHNGDLIYKDRLIGSNLPTRYWGTLGTNGEPLEYEETYEVCPYGEPGDRLWVRETWAKTTCKPDGQAEWHYVYKADDGKGLCPRCQEERYWKPSIHMPREASRITLEITDIRVERVQDISDYDVIAEGLMPDLMDGKPAKGPLWSQFRDLWDSINGKRPGCSWADSPWTWIISFKRVESEVSK